DDLVTGVQTCALPISPFEIAAESPETAGGTEARQARRGQARIHLQTSGERGLEKSWLSQRALAYSTKSFARICVFGFKPIAKWRSEERRVGKECKERV